MENKIEVVFQGHAIGQFLSGPDSEMVIQYMPYRSVWHYEFSLAVQNKETDVTVEIEEDSFKVLEMVKPHYIHVGKVS